MKPNVDSDQHVLCDRFMTILTESFHVKRHADVDVASLIATLVLSAKDALSSAISILIPVS